MDQQFVDAQGVQIGDHGTQTNHFTMAGQSPAAAELQALHPRAAARRIRGMPAEDGAALVAQLAVQPAADLLAELLRHDEPATVAVLTSMYPARAQALIERLTAVADWLADLPRAAAEIRTAHDEARAALGDESGPIARVPNRPLTGFRLDCARGVVHWHGTTGAAVVTGVIHANYVAAWGKPLTSERAGIQRFEHADVHLRPFGFPVPVSGAVRDLWSAEDGRIGSTLTYAQQEGPSPSGATGSKQDFAAGRVSVYATDAFGAFAVSGPVLSRFQKLGGPTGWLGFPVNHEAGDEHEAVQQFEAGTIVWRPDRGAIAVPLAIHVAARERGLGSPTGPVRRLGGGADRAQFFDKRLVTVRDGVAEAWVQPPLDGASTDRAGPG
ncbi:hypothetical protein AB0J72_54070 [Dactylosporangium sp. NPDC049742]|uniref:hypothetical protein n=1 Tax=Dactylosporangium sp. NPDC049742 TaxID=3154737 RepID=UPI0034131668